MLCPRCGTSVGDQVRLCDSCTKEVPQRPAVNQPESVASSKANAATKRLAHELPFDTSFLLAIVSPLGLSVLSIFLWLISSIFFAFELKNNSVGAALLLGAIFVCLTIGLISWCWMWLQLFVDEPMIAFFAVLFPIAVYRVVMTYPERTRTPFLLHVGCGVVGLLLVLLSNSLYEESVFTRATEIFFGADHDSSSIDAGILGGASNDEEGFY